MLISIIGTRPQYIKVKAVHDYCRFNKIPHYIIDSRQHYSKNFSDALVKDLSLRIDESMNINFRSETDFMSKLISALTDSLKEKKDCRVIIYGDTNTSMIAAMVCHKLGIPFTHVEAGARSGIDTPEEVNRKYIDSVSSINFCTTVKDMENCDNAMYAGSLEYEVLKFLFKNEPVQKYGLLTLHRQENMNRAKVKDVFEFIEASGFKVILPVHHRLKQQHFFHNQQLKRPDNLYVVDPLLYTDMVGTMTRCKFIISDSGSVVKTSPFFGKPCVVVRDSIGYTEVIEKGYGKYFNEADKEFLSNELIPNQNFYLYENGTHQQPSEIIVQHTMRL